MALRPLTRPSPTPLRASVSVARTLQPSLRERNVRVLSQHVGRPNFYNVMARVDVRNARKWNEMAQVQAQFARGEGSYNPRTRTYSQSMRESLHRAAIALYQRGPLNKLYDDFIAIHPALFNANGAFGLPVADQFKVLGNTHGNMVRGSVGLDLVEGTFNAGSYSRLANNVAEQTRVSRQRRGLPITPR